MVVDELPSFDERDELPDTVTALVVGFLHFEGLSEKQLRFADRVVEIQGFNSTDKHPTNFSIFPNLKRLTLAFDLEKLVLPTHKLKRLTVRWERRFSGLVSLFPPKCAEQIVVTYRLPEAFAEAENVASPECPCLLRCGRWWDCAGGLLAVEVAWRNHSLRRFWG